MSDWGRSAVSCSEALQQPSRNVPGNTPNHSQVSVPDLFRCIAADGSQGAKPELEL